jgi:hypothetical protein
MNSAGSEDAPMRLLAILGLAVAAVLVIGGCGGSDRSVQAYCDTYFAEKEAYLQKYDRLDDQIDDSDDPLGQALLGVAVTAQAVGDISVFFDKLSQVSPDEVTPDLEEIKSSLDRQRDALADLGDNPLGAIVAGLFSGLSSGGSWQRVAEWTVANCGSA